MTARNNRYLITVLALYLSLTVLYSLSVPLWEAPDEPSHYLCVRRFSEGDSFHPPLYPGPFRDDWSAKHLFSFYQRSQPPLYYILTAPVMKVIASSLFTSGGGIEFPPVRPDFNREGNLFIHRQATVRAIAPAEVTVHILRLFSVIPGCAAVFFIYRLTRLVFPGDPRIALFAGTFAATLPQFNFVTGSISNDSLAAALGAGTLLFLIRRAGKKCPLRPRDCIGLGILLLLSLVTKFNLVFLFPVAFIFICLKAKDARRWMVLPWAATLTVLPVVLAVTAAAILFPAETGLKTRVLTLRLLGTSPALVTFPHFRHMIGALYRSFFALFGWMSIPVNRWLYLTWGGIVAVSLAGLTKEFFPGGMPDENRRRRLGLLAAAFLLLLLGVIKNNFLVRQSQGRFLFPALGAISVLIGYGFWEILPEKRRAAAAVIFPIVLTGLNLTALFAYLLPAVYP